MSLTQQSSKNLLNKPIFAKSPSIQCLDRTKSFEALDDIKDSRVSDQNGNNVKFSNLYGSNQNNVDNKFINIDNEDKSHIFKEVGKGLSSFLERNRRVIHTPKEHALDPVQKFIRYGRFPYKLLFNVIILIMLLVLIFRFEAKLALNGENERKAIVKHFTDSISKVHGASVSKIYKREKVMYMFKRDQVLQSVRNIVQLYYSLSSIVFNDFDMYFNSGYQNFPRVAKHPNRARSKGQYLLPFDKTGRIKEVLHHRYGSSDDLMSLKGINKAAMRMLRRLPVNGYINRDQIHDIDSEDGIAIKERYFSDYYDYVRYLFEINNISNKYNINQSWVLPPTMTLYNFYPNARMNFGDISNKPNIKIFNLSLTNPLGPLHMDKTTGSQYGIKGPYVSGSDMYVDRVAVDSWISAACAPRLDYLFPDEGYFLPCRTPSHSQFQRKRSAFTSHFSRVPPSDAHHFTPYGIFDSISDICVTFHIQQIVNLTTSYKNSLSSSIISGYYKDAWFNWTVNVCYHLEDKGVVKVNVDASYTFRRVVNTVNDYFILIIFLSVFALWDVVLRFKAIQRIYQFRNLIRSKMHKKSSEMGKQDLYKDHQASHGVGVSLVDREYSTEFLDSGLLGVSNQPVSDGTQCTTDSTFIMIPGSTRLRLHKFWKFIESVARGERRREDNNNADASLLSHYSGKEVVSKSIPQFRNKMKNTPDIGLPWHLWALISDVLSISYVGLGIASSMSIELKTIDSRLDRIVLGCAALTSSVLFLSYLRYYPKVYFMIRITSSAIPKLGAFLLGVLPIFVGYILFFASISQCDYSVPTDTIFDTMRILYSSSWKDNVLPVYQGVTNTKYNEILICGIIMYTSFIIIFTWLIANFAIAIVSESYMRVRRKHGLVIGHHISSPSSVGDIKNDGKLFDLRVPTPNMNKWLLGTKSTQLVRREAIRKILKQLTTLDSFTERDLSTEDLSTNQIPRRTEVYRTKRDYKNNDADNKGSRIDHSDICISNISRKQKRMRNSNCENLETSARCRRIFTEGQRWEHEDIGKEGLELSLLSYDEGEV